MADRTDDILMAGLRQALAGPAEQRLSKSGKLDGLFPGRGGAAAASRALADGLLEIVRTETRGKAVVEWVRITPRGVDFLHDHESPTAALHELRHALRLNQQAVPAWLGEMRDDVRALEVRLSADAQKWEQKLDALTRRVEEALRRLEAAAPLLPPETAAAHPWAIDALNYLDRRRTGGAPGDCPLPELFAALTRQHPALSVGAFHDGLRRLHDRRALRLTAADGDGMTQPEFALLDGGKVLYFAGR
jgi:hypothetical protein